MRCAMLVVLGLSITALAACSTPSAASESTSGPVQTIPPEAPSGQAMGVPISDRPAVPLADILANPMVYEGQVVRTSGPVRAVCRHRGCWMDIGAEAEGDGRVHVRSLDHSLVFPREAIGKVAEVEGEIQAMPGMSACGAHGEGAEGEAGGCGAATGGRRVQLAVRGVRIR